MEATANARRLWLLVAAAMPVMLWLALGWLYQLVLAKADLGRLFPAMTDYEISAVGEPFSLVAIQLAFCAVLATLLFAAPLLVWLGLARRRTEEPLWRVTAAGSLTVVVLSAFLQFVSVRDALPSGYDVGLSVLAFMLPGLAMFVAAWFVGVRAGWGLAAEARSGYSADLS